MSAYDAWYAAQDIVQDADKDECFAVCFLLPPKWQLANNKLALSLPRLKCHHHIIGLLKLQSWQFLLLLARTATVLWVRRPKNMLVKWNSRLSPFAIHMGHLLSPSSLCFRLCYCLGLWLCWAAKPEEEEEAIAVLICVSQLV